MVGFPSEREKHFQELKDFVASFRIEHVGIFAYSPEESTRAFRLGDPIPDDVKQARADELRTRHSRFMEKRLAGKVHTIQQSLIEGVSDESDLLLRAELGTKPLKWTACSTIPREMQWQEKFTT